MVRIITDSAADFEPAELEARNIICIPLTVMFGQREYQENVDLTKEQFYELQARSEEPSRTAQASPQLLMDLFEQAHEAGDEAVYITLSSALSGTWQSACMCRDSLGYPQCHVVDSRNATGGQRMLVEYAVKLRDEGKTAAQIIEKLESVRDRIVLYACVDTLEYLYRGGRISRSAYTVGSLAQIKPIIQVTVDGRVVVPAKAIGMRRGMDLLCRKLQEQPMDPEFPLYAMYTKNRAGGEALAQRFRELGYEVPDSRVINVGAAIGSHVGPNACGFVCVSAQ